METAVATKKERKEIALDNINLITQLFVDNGFSVREAVYSLPQSEQSCWDSTTRRWKNTRRAKDITRFIAEKEEGERLIQYLVRVLDADYSECVICIWTLSNTTTCDGTMRILHEAGRPLAIYHAIPDKRHDWGSGIKQKFFDHIHNEIKEGHVRCDVCGLWYNPKADRGNISGIHTYVCGVCAKTYNW